MKVVFIYQKIFIFYIYNKEKNAKDHARTAIFYCGYSFFKKIYKHGAISFPAEMILEKKKNNPHSMMTISTVMKRRFCACFSNAHPLTQQHPSLFGSCYERYMACRFEKSSQQVNCVLVTSVDEKSEDWVGEKPRL